MTLHRDLPAELERAEARIAVLRDALAKTVRWVRFGEGTESDAAEVADSSLFFLDPAAELLLAQVRGAERLYQAAKTIFSVGVPAYAGDKRACPHGNAPFYPAHALWCDECFDTLDDALSTYCAAAKEDKL